MTVQLGTAQRIYHSHDMGKLLLKVRAEKLEEREAKRKKYEQKQLEELKENVSVPLEYEGDDFIVIDDQVSEKCISKFINL